MINVHPIEHPIIRRSRNKKKKNTTRSMINYKKSHSFIHTLLGTDPIGPSRPNPQAATTTEKIEGK